MKEKTKEMADQVGAVYPTLFLGRHDGVLFTETELETFVGLVAAHKAEIITAEAYRCGHEAGAAHEREACAKVCEGRIGGAVKDDQWWRGFRSAMAQCAEAIRARIDK